jgi:hypothetical protein
MNVNGPWCFVENEGEINMEQCDVCQSLGKLIFKNINSYFYSESF